MTKTVSKIILFIGLVGVAINSFIFHTADKAVNHMGELIPVIPLWSLVFTIISLIVTLIGAIFFIVTHRKQ